MRRRQYEVRIIAGALKGRRLVYPADAGVRPTMQRTKTAIFDTLSNRLRGAVFLDLFCGAGGIGIEALSRGALTVHFVENDRRTLLFLRKNLASCAVPPECAQVYAMDVLDFVRAGHIERIHPDTIYGDPPYDEEMIPVLLELLSEIDYPASSLIVLEHYVKPPLIVAGRLTRTLTKTYGQTCVSFLSPTGGYES